MQPRRRPGIVLGILLFIVLVLMLARLGDAPPLFSDEGWALSVARTWVERGQYAELVLGEPVAPVALNIGLPAIAPMALSLRLFGVGPWQGRLPSVIWALGALLLIYALARRLYGEKVALWSALLAVLATGWLAPVMVGKQALGEMPALFLTLAGYLLLAGASGGSHWRYAGAGALWGLAAATKLQALPFILLASLALVGITLWRRERGRAVSWALAIAAMSAALALTRWAQVRAQGLPAAPLSSSGLLLLTSVAFHPLQRVVSLVGILSLGVPSVLGLCYMVMRAPRFPDGFACLGQRDLVRWGLALFAGTWLAWYLTLAVGWGRYLVVPIYASTIFVAAALADVTGSDGLRALVARSARALRQSTANATNRWALGLLLALAMMTASTLFGFARAYLSPPDRSVEEVARYLNTETRPGAVIESYEMEIFPFLDRPYHYPQPREMELILRRHARGEEVQGDYDPLQADPDYLVTGATNLVWHLYDGVISAGEFELLCRIGGYEVYRRAPRAGSAVPPP